jgi:Tfp pilus assembly protein FimT
MTLVEAIVILAIIATLLGLILPLFAGVASSVKRHHAVTSAEREAGVERDQAAEPPAACTLVTVSHEGHWWIRCLSSGHFNHHPDCPCTKRRREASDR